MAGTEFWERISFSGMQALLVLYMVEQLLQPGHIERVVGFGRFRDLIEFVTGHLSTQALASQIFGLYLGLVFLSPTLGGLIGDRLLGRRYAVCLGALLMMAGHFSLVFEPCFLLALSLLVLGAGLLRGNLMSQVGDLYARDDQRRATAFQIYYGMLNAGAFIAPLIAGWLSQDYGWHYGFGFAGVGMLAGLILYLSGTSYVPRDALTASRGRPPHLTVRDRRIVVVLLAMVPLLTTFWIAQSQIWNTYNLWVRDHVNRSILGWQMPVPWLQGIDGLCALVMVPPVLAFWRWQQKHDREPRELSKLSIGCLLYGGALAWLGASQLFIHRGGGVPLSWALLFHVFSNIGYVYFAPTAVAVFARAAPVAINAMMVGLYYVSLFFGSIVSGRLGGLYERLSTAEFWLLHSAIAICGGFLILLFAPRLRQGLALDE